MSVVGCFGCGCWGEITVGRCFTSVIVASIMVDSPASGSMTVSKIEPRERTPDHGRLEWLIE